MQNQPQPQPGPHPGQPQALQAAVAKVPLKHRPLPPVVKVLAVIVILGILSIVPIVILVGAMRDADDTFQVRRVVALAGGNRLVIQRTGNSRVDRNWSRLLLIDARGKVVDEVKDRGGRDTMYYGLAPEGVWLENSSHGLHVRGTTNLQKLTQIVSPKQHDVLARGYTVVGRLDQKLVLLGRDQRDYAVEISRPIERLPKDAKYSPLPHHSTQFRDFDPVGLKSVSQIGGKPFDFEKLDLVDAKAVIDPDTYEAQMFQSPAGFLALSVDVVGRGGNHRLSRVSVDGAIAWTVKTEALLEDTKLDGKPAFRLAWAQIDGNTVHTIVEADILETPNATSNVGAFGRYDARVIDLDAGTGAVQGRWEFTRGKK